MKGLKTSEILRIYPEVKRIFFDEPWKVEKIKSWEEARKRFSKKGFTNKHNHV